MKEDTKGLWQRVRSLTKTQTEETPDTPSLSSRTKAIWGESFAIVSNGLDEGQVRRYVDDLLVRYNQMKDALERKESSATVNSYLQKVMSEIQQVEDTVKTQISKDAESEGSRIIAEARQEAQDLVTRARREASSLASQEAEGILAAAKKKAEIAEGQIRLQAQLMMEKAQDQLKGLIRQEGTEAYRRLLSALKSLGAESEHIEEEWKRRSARLWNADDFRVVLDDTPPPNDAKDSEDDS